MNKIRLTIICALLPLGLFAQEQYARSYDDSYEQTPQQSDKQSKKPRKKASEVFTGFSGGMMLHGGYLFADNPQKLFSNSGLGDKSYVRELPKRGFTFGLGGALRAHLINHIHLGAEGFVSTMPLMGTGSSVRSGWGGVLCDVYTDWGKVRPLVGMTVGGGSMRRLFVPDGAETVDYATSDKIYYNASYTQTPFFFIDPYIGMEIGLNAHMALLIRIDYLLPFGKTSSSLTGDVNWSKFMCPNGPRLYIGVMFGKYGNSNSNKRSNKHKK